MRAMAAPSAGVADAGEAKVNETAAAATTANKVIFIRFLPVICMHPNSGRAEARPGPQCEPVLSNFAIQRTMRS
jgi:hypothetical protein